MSKPHLTGIRWMGWLFIVGSACFVLGVPLSVWLPDQPAVAASTYFVGSLFFTSAATVQTWLARVQLPSLRELPPGRRVVRLIGIKTAEWSSSWIQWLGTLAFNVTTCRALVDSWGSSEVSGQLVWRPDAVGSALFLGSSLIAMRPEVRRFRTAHVRNRSWAIAALNLLGSILFGISAIGGYTLPSTGELVSLSWANAGTLLGALCFLVGARLLLPKRTRPSAARTT